MRARTKTSSVETPVSLTSTHRHSSSTALRDTLTILIGALIVNSSRKNQLDSLKAWLWCRGQQIVGWYGCSFSWWFRQCAYDRVMPAGDARPRGASSTSGKE